MQQFEMNCASRGFHVYRDVWQPRRGEILEVEHDYGNVHDPFAISINTSSRGRRVAMFAMFDIVGHLPREISRFCHYFLSYGGSLEARVRDIKPRRSPIPRGGLEIPIILIVKKESADNKVFAKMKELVEEFYVEPENITKSLAQSNVESRVDEIDLEEHSPDEVGEEMASVANEDDNMEDDDVIVIDD